MAKNIKKALRDFWFGKPHSAEEGGRRLGDDEVSLRLLFPGFHIERVLLRLDRLSHRSGELVDGRRALHSAISEELLLGDLRAVRIGEF